MENNVIKGKINKKVLADRAAIYFLCFFAIVMLCIQCSDRRGGEVEAGNGNDKAANHIELPESFAGKIAFQSDQDGDNEIYLLDKKGVKKLTDNKYEDEYPLWDERGEMIIFESNPSGKDNYDI